MTKRIETAAVLGSGVMGSGIAALLAGAGIRTYLLDIVPKEGKDRNAIAAKNLQLALKSKPAAFYSANDAQLVTPGNFDDDMDKLKNCDWVIEVVVERLDIKQQLIKKVAAAVGPHTIVTSNTSGIDIDAIVDGLPLDFRKRWLGTHFFNPPRYMKLLEIIPGKATDPAITQFIADFGRDQLGKGIVYAKNTPNFIANRIGVFGMMQVVNQMVSDNFTIEQVDALFGKAMGRPKSAVFKTSDLVGIDTMKHVADNTYAAVVNDPFRETFKVPTFVQKMVEKGLLGKKTDKGFYAKVGGKRCVLNPATLEYVETTKTSFPCTDKAKKIEDVRARIKAVLMESDDEGAKFAWKSTVPSLIYSATMIPEISDTTVEIDRGMRWGYNWEVGPFELWDAIGVAESVARMEKEGHKVPANVKKMLASGAKSFYEERKDGLYYYDLIKGGYQKVDEDPKSIRTEALRKAGKLVQENAGASIYDMDDGVLLVEFHTKMNAVDDDIVNALNDAMTLAESSDKYKGVVVGNHADAFSAGANLLLVFMLAQQGEWDKLHKMVREFQACTMRMRYSRKPVVAAVGGLALGGGCEIAMHANHVILAGESYVGLVEVGVGLIPAGGGCKEFLVKVQEGDMPELNQLPLPATQKVFESIAMAKVGTSGKEAIENGVFRRWEADVVLNRDHILLAAKQKVLAMSQAGFVPPAPYTIRLAGGGVYGALLVGADGLLKSGFATQYDIIIARKLAKIITGGKIPEGTVVDEQFVLDLEREAFIELLHEQKSLDRIQHMLMNNKPLRN